MPDSVIAKKKKRSGLVLVQLLIVAGLLAVVWFSFGQNVLAPQEQMDVPQRLGTLELISSTQGSAALAQVNRLHGTDIELVSAYIAEYARGNERVTVWVGRAENSSAGAELTEIMLQAIENGGSPFSNLKRLYVADHEVFRVDGPGGEHFFYNSIESGEEVVWLTVEETDGLLILEEALKTF